MVIRRVCGYLGILIEYNAMNRHRNVRNLGQVFKERPGVFFADYRRKSEDSQKRGRLTDTSFKLRM